MAKYTERAEPWVLLMRPWHPHTGDSVTTHYSRDQAVAQAREFLLDDRRQTAYVGRMKVVLGIKKEDTTLSVVEVKVRFGGAAWEDVEHDDWPGTAPDED